MRLEGSCHCQAVRFSVESAHPYPFNICYCSICRKTAGGGGYAINLGAQYATMQVQGEQSISVYHAMVQDQTTRELMPSPAQRHFCRACASALWIWDARWPAQVYPFASAIDTELPEPPERLHMMLADKPAWVLVHQHVDDKCCRQFPEESMAQWHERLGLVR